MATPAYIFACYECVASKTMHNLNDANNPNDNSNHDCNNHNNPNDNHNQNDVNKKHLCPANPDFIPDMNCEDHVECNDPIFRYLEFCIKSNML